MEEQDKTEEKKPEFKKLLEIYISPEGLVDLKGPLHAKPLLIDALATAIKIVIAYRPPRKRIISGGGAMRRFARKVGGAFGGKR